MKKLFITFLIFIINFGLFHLSFAQAENELFSAECNQLNNSHQKNKSSDCFKECLSNIKKISSLWFSQNEQKPYQKSLETPIVLWEYQNISYYFQDNLFLFYQKKFIHIQLKLYHNLIWIIKNIT